MTDNSDDALEFANSIQAHWGTITHWHNESSFLLQVEVECIYCGECDKVRDDCRDDEDYIKAMVEEATHEVKDKLRHAKGCIVLRANAHVKKAMDDLFVDPDPVPDLPDAGDGFIWVTNEETGVSFKMPDGKTNSVYDIDNVREGIVSRTEWEEDAVVDGKIYRKAIKGMGIRYRVTHDDGSHTVHQSRASARNAAQSYSQVTRDIKDQINDGMTADKVQMVDVGDLPKKQGTDILSRIRNAVQGAGYV